MSASVKLIVGLGNPSDEYADTRHNVGIWFVEALANQGKNSLRKEDKFYGAIAKLNDCWILKPLIYMNENWRAVVALARFYEIKPQEILVVYDALEFPVGVIRLKENGGHGGHNGLRNIIEHLGTTNFYRLRIGIGHPGHKDQTIPYVLGRPHKEDRATILTAISKGLKITDELTQGEFEKAMNNLHS